MNYKTYNEYKITNNLFFNKIPINWSIFKLKHMIATLESGKRKDFEDTKFAFSIGGEHINWNGTLNLTNERYITEEFYNSLSKGKINEKDVLLVKDGATIGKTAFINKLNQKMAVNEHVFILRNNERLIPKLLYYLITSHLGFTQIKLTETGSAQGGISQDIGDKVDFVIPHDLIEQQQIANYLDKKTAKIDATIAKNKQLIDLLEEKRVALINQVVTKGLNPDVPMKDSGVEWIGEIPEHWKTNKIKNMSYVKGRIGWHGLTSEEYSDEGAYLVTGTDFKEGIVDWEHCNHISYERYKQDPNIHLKTGDLLITKDGTIGKLALIKDIPDKATLNSGIFLVRPLKDNYTNDYLYWILSSDIFVRFFDYIKTGATIAHLYQETFERFFFPFPHIDEQNLIVQYLNDNVSKINLTIHKVEENIALLEEYKTSLIHHVVTGKIDVRSEKI